MSARHDGDDRRNEYDNPGANHPATESGHAERPEPDDVDTAVDPHDSADHHGQDGAPAMSQNNATDEDKLQGIVSQTRADLAGADAARVLHALRERIAQAGLTLEPDREVEIADQIATGAEG